jgi:hypothetical protein
MILDYSLFGESLTPYGRYPSTYLFDTCSMILCICVIYILSRVVDHPTKTAPVQGTRRMIGSDKLKYQGDEGRSG